MSNVIRFLERMGGDAAAATMSAAEYEAAVAFIDADEASREALLARDSSRLSDLLNARPVMYCNIACPDDDQHHERPGEDDDEGDPRECPSDE